MAVDTRNKRASVLSYSRPMGRVWPNPDGSLANQADRQHMGYIYPGISAVGPPTGHASRLPLLGVNSLLLPLLLGDVWLS